MLVLLLSFFSCMKKKDGDVGLEFQDQNNLLSANVIDTFSLTSSSVYATKFAVSNSSRLLFGSYVDPVFGELKNSIYTQIRLNGDFLDFSTQSSSGEVSDLLVDSVVLFLEYYPGSELYGENITQSVSVFEIEEDMSTDSAYLSDRFLAVGSQNLVDPMASNISFNLVDSIQYDGETIPASLIVKLDPIYGQGIINLSASQTISKEDFSSFVKGLNIVPNNVFSSGQGCIAAVNPLSFFSRVKMYYHDVNDNTAYEYSFLINDLCAYYSSFDHDYSGSTADMLIDNPELGNETFYVQSGFGMQAKVDLPSFNNVDSLPFKLINRAILYIPVKEGSDDIYDVPSQILVTYINDDGEEVFFNGHLSDLERLYNDFYNAVEKRYEINLTSYLQDVITGADKNRTLYLSSINSAVSINRAVLNGNESPTNQMKLEVVYTKNLNN